MGVAQDTKGFLPSLFDFSFTHFVTPKLVRFVYLLATIALGLAWVAWLFSAFAWGAGYGVFVLLIGPVLLVIYLAVIRMTLEFYLSIVRMSEDIHKRLPQA
jgi:predicted PurR-regulated permease PerM